MKALILSILTIPVLMLAQPAMAVHTPDGSGHSIAVRVNGLVCDFCAQAITTLMKKQDGVSDVGISLEKGLVTIDMTEGATLSDEMINTIMTDSGYSVVEIVREGQ
jgi:mercuric ion binding protein